MANTERGPDAVERTVAVLQALAASPAGASLTELAKATGIPATTLHRVLGVLRRHALVREAADGRYALASGTVALARAYLDGLDLRQEALKLMRPLSEGTGETCQLGVLALVHVVYIEQVDAPGAGTQNRVGQTDPALNTALGRAILAHAPQHTFDEVLQAHARQSGTTVDLARTQALLAEVRAHGFARVLADSDLGVHSVAAPVLDHTGHVVAGLSICGPAARLDARTIAQLGPQVRAAAESVSRQLGWDGTELEPAEEPEAARAEFPIRPRGRPPAPRKESA